jgi:hypothetical protein
MTYVDNNYPTSQYGATREHRKGSSAEALLKTLMDRATDPHSWEERNDIKAEITTTLRSKEGQKYIESVIDGWFQNAYRRLLKDYPNGDAPPEREVHVTASKTKQVEVEQKLEKAIDRRVKLKLLDLVLPNGKALRDCTGRECRALGKKTNRWLVAIADRIKPTDLVGAVMSETAVRRMYPK